MIEATKQDQAELLQIGAFAKAAGTNLRTLRYYEELGLIEPAGRSPGGFRHYDRHQLERIAAIKRLQQLGLSLKEIQTFMSIDRTSSNHVAERVDGALNRQIALIEDRIKAMQHDLAELRVAKEKIAHCKACDVTLTPDNCASCRQDHKPLHPVIRALL
ncbi:MAG: MerR family transcriptional regulator [Planctomycetes bacterium]|nr:MerR family transcriptional regulator [Planctomycetota bacterium]